MRLIKYCLDPMTLLILPVVVLFCHSLASQSYPAKNHGARERANSFTEVFGVRAKSCGSNVILLKSSNRTKANDQGFREAHNVTR